jgi:hypothetical protein
LYYQKDGILRIAGHIIIVSLILFFSTGCEPESSTSLGSSTSPRDVLSVYAASKVRIIGLTEITPVPTNQWTSNLKVYVDLLDNFACRVKSPGTFRFELYEFVPRSSRPKGKRIFIWPDIDLTEATNNNSHWRDFLRAYQFDLDLNFRPKPDETFILEVTFTTPAGKRLSDLFQLKYEK